MSQDDVFYTKERFKKDPAAQKLMRQFMHSGGEGGGAGRSPAFRAGYCYAFELNDEQRRAVDDIRAAKPDIELHQAILEALGGTDE